jgi:hypothetical protein
MLTFPEYKVKKIPRARVNISEFPYGRISAALRKAAKWINSNNRKIKCSALEFCLPASIYGKLSTDEFDFLEEQTFDRREYF